MRRVAVALCVLWLSAPAASAGWVFAGSSIDHDMIARVDWQYSSQLPPRFRNHCRYEYFTARPYCSDHCGSDYQFYYCSDASFGCCHLGRGYCDWSGLLRCHP